ncbi:MAG: hypothetical protein WCT03_13325 [Candidatus Obscuribacterales bacterium]|jgi:hypothetical protein
MGALEHSGSADNFQRANEQVSQAQLSPEHYQSGNPAGRDNRSAQNDGLDAISNTVNTKERPVEAVAACTLAAFANIEGRNAPISAAGLKNIANLMECNNDVLGVHGLTKNQSAIPAAALERFGGFLTLQAENHPAPDAKAAIYAVINRYFKPAQA